MKKLMCICAAAVLAVSALTGCGASAGAPLGFHPVPGEWYKVKVEVCGNRIRVFVNDEKLPHIDLEDKNSNLAPTGEVALGGGLPGRTHPSGQLCLFRGGRIAFFLFQEWVLPE